MPPWEVAAFEALGIERGLLPVRVYRGAAGSISYAYDKPGVRRVAATGAALSARWPWWVPGVGKPGGGLRGARHNPIAHLLSCQSFDAEEPIRRRELSAARTMIALPTTLAHQIQRPQDQG